MEGDVGRKVIQGKTDIESEILYSMKQKAEIAEYWLKSTTEQKIQFKMTTHTQKGVYYFNDVTWTQQQRPEEPTATLAWPASKHKVHYNHHKGTSS